MKGKIYDITNEDISRNSHLSPSKNENDATPIRMLHENNVFEDDSDDHVYYRFAALAQRTLRVPYAVISLDDGKRKLFESKIGFSETENISHGSICEFTVLSEGKKANVVFDALSDARFKDNPIVIGPPFFRFYAGTTLIVDGLRVGTLCVFDTTPRLDFGDDEIMILFDFGSTVSTLIKTQREMQSSLQAKYNERLKLEQKKFASNLVMEKNKIIVDLMHQVRTPLMGIQLSVSIIESEQHAISELVQNNPNVDTVNKIGSTIQELKSATSQLDNYITTNLKSDANMIIDNSLNRILNRNTSFSHDRLANTINSKTIPCNLDEFLCSIRHKCSTTIQTTEIEWTVNPCLTARSLETHPDALQTILCSVLTNASTLWSQATVTFEMSERCGCHTTEDLQTILQSNQYKSQDSWTGFISITIRLYNPLPLPLSYHQDHTELDTKPVEAILSEIGGCYRVFNFDSDSSSSSFPIICDEKDRNGFKMKEQLLEFFIPSVFSNNDEGIEKGQLGPSDDNNMLPYCESSSSGSSSRPLAKVAPLYRMRTMSLSEESRCSCSSLNEAIERYSQNSGKDSHTSQSYCTNENNRIRPLLPRRAFFSSDSDSSSSCPDHVKKLPSSSSLLNGRPLQVLLVDDSAIIYKVMKKWLEAEGCEVTIAENGKIALSYLKIHQYDITLMDFIMPVMLGKVAMRYYQEWQMEYPHLHLNQEMLLIGMSANASPHDQKEAFQYGMHYFATKPMELTFLKTVLEAKKKYSNLQQTIRWIDFMTDNTSLTVINGSIWKEKERGWTPSIPTKSPAVSATTTTTIRKRSTESGIRKSSVVLKLEQSILEDNSFRTQCHVKESEDSNTDEMVSISPLVPSQGCFARLKKYFNCIWSRNRSNSHRNAEQQQLRFSKKVLPVQVIN